MILRLLRHWTAGLFGMALATAPALAQFKEVGELPGDKTPEVKFGSLKDLAGDPLPEGARVRLGTARFRTGEYIPASSLSPDGKLLAMGSNRDTIHLMDPKTGKEVRRISLNGQGLTYLAFTPDSKKIAAMGYGPGIRLFDVATGKVVGPALQIQQAAPGKMEVNFRGTAFSFSADGKIMAAGNEGFGQEKTFLYSWDVASGKQLHQYQVMQNYSIRVAVAPDGKKLASWGHYNPRGGFDNENIPGKTIQLWDVQSGKEVLKIKLDRYPINAATFSPDGKTLAVHSGQASFHAFDAASGKELRRYVGRRGQVFQLRYSPDGQALYASTIDGVVQSWEAESGKRIGLAEGPVRAQSHLAFPPLTLPSPPAGGEGKVSPPAGGEGRVRGHAVLALSYMGQALYLWDGLTGKSLIPADGHHNRITAVTYDGKSIVTAGADGKVCWWDPATGKEDRHMIVRDDDSYRYGGPPRLGTFAISPDAKYIAAGSDYGNAGIRLWELQTGKVICDLEGPRANSQVAPTFSPDSKYLAAGGFDSVVYIWEVDTGRELRPIRFKEVKGNQFSSDNVRVAFAPGGKTIAISDRGYDRVTGQPTSDLSLWDVAKGKQLGQTLKIGMGMGAPVFSGDGKFLAIPSNRAVVLLRADNCKEVKALEVGGNYYNLFALTFSPDGRTVAAATQGGNYRGEVYDVYVFEIASGHQRQVLRGHQGPVNCLAYSADGRSLVTGSGDTTALVWDLTGQILGGIKTKVDAQGKDKLWNELAAARNDHFQLYRRLLAAPAQTIELIKENLKPVQGVKVEPGQIDKLIADLDHEQFTVRIKASRALEQLGEIAGPALLKARETQDKLEPRRRIDALLDKLERTSLTTDELRGVRAIEILELIGTPEARTLLAALAEGAGHSRLTQDARKAVARVKGR